MAYTDVMYQCCDALQTMMQELSGYQKSKVLKQSIEHLNSLEEKGDVLYSRTTRDLFTEVLDAVEVIKWRSIFDRMEKCCDACEAVAHQVETIIMKNV